ncbi:hypothetical protein [uncultured Xylophilus sp.]|uniref:hypothetical protein n=1 Tax=uncultured Xylophilus sp. TaxID=296832 RepID=UPI0025D21905|nr:hypothetical protein [uncultured Xylophilus sp.]
MTDEDRALGAATAAWLDAAAVPAAWGLALAALAVAVLLAFEFPGTAVPAALAAVAALGLPERYLALRLRFDAGLFRALADGRIASLSGLDGALAGLGLRSDTAATDVRPLPDRVQGALRLLRVHRNIVLLQAVLVAVALGAVLLPADDAPDAGPASFDMTSRENAPWTPT